MFDVPPQFWEYLAKTSDGLGLLGFLNGLVRFVGQRKAAGEKATIEDYLELVRRGEHKEICELVLQNQIATESLRQFTAHIVAESTDRIIGELRNEADEIKRLIVAQSAVRDRPEIAARVSRQLGPQAIRNDGERSFQIKFMLKNKSRGPANVKRAVSYLTIAGTRVPCSEGELIHGCRLPQQNETRELMAHTLTARWPDGEPALVCLKLEVEQDDGAIRYYVPRNGGAAELAEIESDPGAGLRWMMKARAGRPAGPVTLLRPSDNAENAWTARDKDGQVFDVHENWLVPGGAVLRSES